MVKHDHSYFTYEDIEISSVLSTKMNMRQQLIENYFVMLSYQKITYPDRRTNMNVKTSFLKSI